MVRVRTTPPGMVPSTSHPFKWAGIRMTYNMSLRSFCRRRGHAKSLLRGLVATHPYRMAPSSESSRKVNITKASICRGPGRGLRGPTGDQADQRHSGARHIAATALQFGDRAYMAAVYAYSIAKVKRASLQDSSKIMENPWVRNKQKIIIKHFRITINL